MPSEKKLCNSGFFILLATHISTICERFLIDNENRIFLFLFL